MFLLLNQSSNNMLGVLMRQEPGLVPGHYLILCFPKSTRQTFSPSFCPESTSRCPREGWFDGGAGAPGESFPGSSHGPSRRANQGRKEGWSPWERKFHLSSEEALTPGSQK